MKLSLYDSQLNRLAIIENRFVSCLWSEGYNTTQPFTLELLATEEYRRKVRPECYVGRSDRNTLMVIKTVELKSGHLVASGFQAGRCLDDVACRQVIPAGAVVDASLKEAWEESEGFESLAFETPHLDVTYGHQISSKTFLALCETMCQETDTGFRVVRAGGQLLARFYRPEPRENLVLSEAYGNLQVESITLSTQNLRNHALVLGEGEGKDRFQVEVDQSEGGQKRSLIVDARDIRREEGESSASYAARLRARGAEKLLEQRKTWECAFVPLPGEFGKRYDLGDVVTVLLPEEGLRLQARITRFTQRSQNNLTSTTVEAGSITIVR